MDRISHTEDKNALARAVKSRDYSAILELPEDCTCSSKAGDRFYGANIRPVPQLQAVYGKPVFSVSFLFKNIARAFDDQDKAEIQGLLDKVTGRMSETEGYYIVKIPSHVMTLMNCLSTRPNMLFAGGTVCYLYASGSVDVPEGDCKVRLLGQDELARHRDPMIRMGEDGFRDYFGQYHISEYTRQRAGIIYRNWVKEFVEAGKGVTLGAFIGEDLVGFLNCEEDDSAFELVLSSVSEKARGRGVYEAMIRCGTRLGIERGKIVTTSTQFDNFAVQKAWSGIGFKPYYSFYVMHFNNAFENL